jgi:hypothetical protein
MKQSDSKRSELRDIARKAEGLLRTEVRLTESKTIRAYTDETNTAGQIAELSEKSEKIFLDTFMRIVPFGDFHKKYKAVEIIRKDVTDVNMKRRMLRLVELIPEKKSLLLAQRALRYRRVDVVMENMGAIKLSPVTISKRSDIKHLKNLYSYL